MRLCASDSGFASVMTHWNSLPESWKAGRSAVSIGVGGGIQTSQAWKTLGRTWVQILGHMMPHV